MSGSSSRHVRALADAFLSTAPQGAKRPEGYENGEWVLLDMQDVIIHIFCETARQYYNLDKLWSHVASFDATIFVKRCKLQQPHSFVR